MIRRPPRSTRTDTLFPYTTLFRSPFWSSTISMRPTFNGHVPRPNVSVSGWPLRLCPNPKCPLCTNPLAHLSAPISWLRGAAMNGLLTGCARQVPANHNRYDDEQDERSEEESLGRVCES